MQEVEQQLNEADISEAVERNHEKWLNYIIRGATFTQMHCFKGFYVLDISTLSD